MLNLTKDTYERAGLTGQRAHTAYGAVRFGMLPAPPLHHCRAARPDVARETLWSCVPW